MSKNIRNIAQRISSNISSGIVVDQQDILSKNLVQIMQSKIKTQWNLKQTELNFIDFKRKEFPELAKNQYIELCIAYKKKNKVSLMQLLSVPLYDLVKSSLKQQCGLPFTLHEHPLEAHLVQARQYINQLNGGGKDNTWHQITIKYTFLYTHQYATFERRQTDKTIQDWRIAHIQ